MQVLIKDRCPVVNVFYLTQLKICCRLLKSEFSFQFIGIITARCCSGDSMKFHCMIYLLACAVEVVCGVGYCPAFVEKDFKAVFVG